MMPVFGDVSRFAVEYNLDEDYGGEWLFGRFCYWCSGARIGDFELGTSLRDILFQLERIAGDAGRRTNLRFRGMRTDQVFNLLNAALFGREEPTQSGIANEEQWARHAILPSVDVFDEWKGFLVEEDTSARLITTFQRSGRIEEMLLKTGEVDHVLKAVVLELEVLHAQA
jgi:hypothetical protein